MRATSIAVATLALVGLLAGAANALPAHKHVTLEADDGDTCLDQQAVDCFRVANGSLDGFEQGMRVHLTVENVGDNPHNAYVTEQANADNQTRDTSGDDAINGTDTADPGNTVEMAFTVPEDAEGLYLWCEVSGHEAAGMYLTADVAEASGSGDGNGTGSETGGEDDEGADDPDGDDGSQMIPAPGAGLLGLAGLAAALAVRRR